MSRLPVGWLLDLENAHDPVLGRERLLQVLEYDEHVVDVELLHDCVGGRLVREHGLADHGS